MMEQLISQYAWGFIIFLWTAIGLIATNSSCSWSNRTRCASIQAVTSVKSHRWVWNKFIKRASTEIFSTVRISKRLSWYRHRKQQFSVIVALYQLLTKTKKNEDLTINDAITPKATDVTNIIKSKRQRRNERALLRRAGDGKNGNDDEICHPIAAAADVVTYHQHDNPISAQTDDHVGGAWRERRQTEEQYYQRSRNVNVSSSRPRLESDDRPETQLTFSF